MLAKKERLTREEFNRFFVSGKRFHSGMMQLVHAPHNSFHASVVVSKKVERRAVKRNKLRRQVYDIVRRAKTHEGLTGVYIIMLKPAAAQLSFQELKEHLTTLIGRTKNSR